MMRQQAFASRETIVLSSFSRQPGDSRGFSLFRNLFQSIENMVLYPLAYRSSCQETGDMARQSQAFFSKKA